MKGKPILNMEILVEKGRMDYIVLYEEDDMQKKINDFIIKHKLQPVQATNLKNIVSLKVNKFI